MADSDSLIHHASIFNLISNKPEVKPEDVAYARALQKRLKKSSDPHAVSLKEEMDSFFQRTDVSKILVKHFGKKKQPVMLLPSGSDLKRLINIKIKNIQKQNQGSGAPATGAPHSVSVTAHDSSEHVEPDGAHDDHGGDDHAAGGISEKLQLNFKHYLEKLFDRDFAEVDEQHKSIVESIQKYETARAATIEHNARLGWRTIFYPLVTRSITAKEHAAASEAVQNSMELLELETRTLWILAKCTKLPENGEQMNATGW